MTQAQALTILKTGANIFLTGEPGAGKTHTINTYVSYLHAHGIDPAITASTGIAATHIHGMTIHSWSGIGIRKSLSPYDLDHIASTEYIARKINRTRVLIIDEISMIDGATLDMVDMVCREVRQSMEPFGGIQVILVGDFFQLPPVARAGDKPQFAFESRVWGAMNPIVCYLTEQHRQHDEQFLSLLSAIRTNSYDVMHNDYLETRRIEHTDGITSLNTMTRLFPHNANVDIINDGEISKLPGTIKHYSMTEKGSASLVASLKKGCLSPEVLELKIGTIVMCTKNNREKDFVNGTLGTVKAFEQSTNYPIIETREGRSITIEPMEWVIEEQGKTKASITQIPLRLAWAITIHKSQGMSLDAAVMDLSQVFEFGQGYVALSRVRAFSGLYLLGWNPQTFMVHPRILAKDVEFKSQSDSAAYTFSDMNDTELQTMHTNFIIASGGTVKGISKKKLTEKIDTLETTRVLVMDQNPVSMIAKERGVTVGTIMSHIEKLVEQKRLMSKDITYFLKRSLLQSLPDIEKAFITLDTNLLSPVHEHFKGRYTYDDIRMARIAIRAEKNEE